MTNAPAPDAATRRLLKCLSKSGVWLEPSHGPGEAVPGYRLASQAGTDATGARFPRDIVVSAADNGWLRQGEGRITLTAAGAASLRRVLSGGANETSVASRHPAPPRSPATGAQRARRQPDGDVPGINETESPLGWLRRRKDKSGVPLISDEQFAAGERLRADVFFAGLSPRVTSSWSATAGVDGGRRSPGGGAAQMLDTMIAARQRVDRAAVAVGPELAGVLMDVCGFMKGLELVEAERGWPARSGKVVLLIGLSRLAAHYGLSRPATAGRAAARDLAGPVRIRHWGADDYRPTLEGWDAPSSGDRHSKPH